jgi:hypothetical protein
MKTTLFVLCLSCFVNSVSAENPVPQPEPLLNKYRHEMWAGSSLYGYALGEDAVFLHQIKSAAFPLYLFGDQFSKDVQSGKRTVPYNCVGCIAVDLASGKSRIFHNPLLKDETIGEMTCQMVPLQQTACAIAFYQSNLKSDSLVTVYSRDITTGEAVPLGQWPLGMLGLVGAVNRSKVSVSWGTLKNEKWNGAINILCNNRNLHLSVPKTYISNSLPNSPMLGSGVWFQPAVSDDFILYESGDGHSVKINNRITLYSPGNQPDIRWTVSQSDIDKAINSTSTSITPLPGQSPSSRRIVLTYQAFSDKTKLDTCGFMDIDSSSGKIGQVYSYHTQSVTGLLPSASPITNSDGSNILFQDDYFDASTNKRISCYGIINLNKSTIKRWPVRVDSPVGGIQPAPIGFMNDNCFVTANTAIIEEWKSEKGVWKSRVIFKLSAE